MEPVHQTPSGIRVGRGGKLYRPLNGNNNADMTVHKVGRMNLYKIKKKRRIGIARVRMKIHLSHSTCTLVDKYPTVIGGQNTAALLDTIGQAGFRSKVSKFMDSGNLIATPIEEGKMKDLYKLKPKPL